jgi:hypothetical protein
LSVEPSHHLIGPEENGETRGIDGLDGAAMGRVCFGSEFGDLLRVIRQEEPAIAEVLGGKGEAAGRRLQEKSKVPHQMDG